MSLGRTTPNSCDRASKQATGSRIFFSRRKPPCLKRRGTDINIQGDRKLKSLERHSTLMNRIDARHNCRLLACRQPDSSEGNGGGTTRTATTMAQLGRHSNSSFSVPIMRLLVDDICPQIMVSSKQKMKHCTCHCCRSLHDYVDRISGYQRPPTTNFGHTLNLSV